MSCLYVYIYIYMFVCARICMIGDQEPVVLRRGCNGKYVRRHPKRRSLRSARLARPHAVGLTRRQGLHLHAHWPFHYTPPLAPSAPCLCGRWMEVTRLAHVLVATVSVPAPLADHPFSPGCAAPGCAKPKVPRAFSAERLGCFGCLAAMYADTKAY